MIDTVPCSFHTLHQHSIFQPAPPSSDTSDRAPLTQDDLIPSRKQRLVMRDKEIIVAIGKEVRLANLSGDGFEVRNGSIGKYSTLVSPALTFDIQSLLVNPTGRLLAIIGRTQLVILALPRAGSVGRGEVPCRSIVIDAPQYSSTSLTTVAKVLWHPLGQNGESLWVLSSDGQLREYDIQSPHDPTQTFAFLPPSPSAGSYFSAVDPLSRIASSFTFGPSTRAGWGECSIYGLLANGDLYTLCPVIPFRTEVTIKWVQRLKSYVGQKGTEEEGYWLEGSMRQIRLEDKVGMAGGSPEGKPTPTPKLSVLGRSTMLRPQEKTEEIDTDQLVRLHPPHLTLSGGPAPGQHPEVERQGPVVLEGGEEGDEEDVAGDLIMLSVSGEAKGGKGKGEVRVLGVCWGSGRVDVGVEVERVQGRWAALRGSRSKPPATSTIPVLESIQLDVPADYSFGTSSFTTDPLHPDTFYIQHSTGVDAISVQGMVTALTTGARDIPACDVAQLVSTAGKSQSIEGLTTCYNFSLGYGVLALSSGNRLAAVELDYRSTDKTDSPVLTIPTAAASTEDASTGPDHSLLTSQPLNLDHILSTLRPSPTLTTSRSALQKLSTARKPLETIGAEHLRAIGDLISNLQSRIEAIRTASQAVERHLDLQTREFQRQIQLLQSSSEGLDRVKKHDAVKRAEGMMLEQGRLAGRMDKVLSGLTGMYRPPIGEVEKVWFEQLEGLRKAVRGSDGFGVHSGGGLAGQVEELETDLEELKPTAEATNRDLSTAPPSKKAGPKQLRPLESALYQKMDEIGRLMRKMEGLKVEVDDVLDGRPHK